MKRQLFFYFAWMILSFSSCSNDSTKEPGGIQPAVTSGSTDGNNTIRFRVNGGWVKTHGWNISRFDMGNGTQLNITSDMHEDKRTVMINVKSAAPGTYSLQTGGQAYGDYKPDYADLLNSYRFEKGTICISSIDTVKNMVTATFQGTLKNSEGKSLEITEGSISNGRLTGGVNTY